MIILDNTYFQGELYLAGLKKTSSTVGVADMLQAVNEKSLAWYVEKYEVEFLHSLLGRELATNFIKGLKEDPIEDIWTELRAALVTETENFNYSPIANYVYFYVTRSGRTQTSQKGEVVSKQDHAAYADNVDKLSKVWNDMYYEVKDFYRCFLLPRWDKYKEFSNGRLQEYDFGLINAMDI